MPHLFFDTGVKVKNPFLTLPSVSALLLCLITIPQASANDDDTRFIQDQTRRSIQQKSQAEEKLAAPPGTLMYEGRRYQVASTLESLTPAIYVAINTNQWTQLPDFIARYRELPGHRPALANMAESLYARFQGKYPQALRLMEQANEQEPQDARIQLELARLWFEDHQEQRAAKGFERVLTMGLPARPDCACTACATSSLPVPVSPVMSTLRSLAATRAMSFCSWRMAGLEPCKPRSGAAEVLAVLLAPRAS